MPQGNWQTAGSASFANITGEPSDNDNLNAALTAKADLVGGVVPVAQLPSAAVGGRVQVRVATTANVTISTALNNGDTIDGVTLATNDLVLVGNQTTKAENGIYVVGAVPARSTSYDAYDDYVGLDVFVSVGTSFAGSVWSFSATAGGTIDVTDLNVTQIDLTGAFLASNNLNDLASASTARTNLGLGTAATLTAGVAASGDLPTRANGDTRWLRMFDGLPAGSVGADGDYGVLIDKPQRGTLILKTAGTWAKLDKSYTWAGRPTASSYTGEVITISDWNTDFFSDGTNWIPVGKRVRSAILSGFSGTATVTGTLTETNQHQLTIPAGLVIAGCEVSIIGQWSGNLGTSTKTIRIKDTVSTSIYSFGQTNTQNITRARPTFLVLTQAGTHTAPPAGSNLSGNTTGGDDQTVTANFANATTWTFSTQLGNTGDSTTIEYAGFEINYA